MKRTEQFPHFHRIFSASFQHCEKSQFNFVSVTNALDAAASDEDCHMKNLICRKLVIKWSELNEEFFFLKKMVKCLVHLKTQNCTTKRETEKNMEKMKKSNNIMYK